jgi:exonuclease SbcC
MIIRRITINNIRSYKSPSPIDLSTGVTLFEGDIGSGKSTILSAIEFAMFGLGDIDSSYLLRHGERKGSVLLEFEVNGLQYKAYRSLERKKSSISQKEGYIVEQGVRTDYSVTEMKTRVLEILNFNECAKPKTSYLIYRYAIFTPQEMMKEVLAQPVDKRLETLRRAFRIEDYSVIVNNATVLVSWLESDAKYLSKQAQDIGEKRQLLSDENNKKDEFTAALEKIASKYEELKVQIEESRTQIEGLTKRKENVLKLAAEIPGIERELEGKNAQLSENKTRKEMLSTRLTDIVKSEKKLVILEPNYNEFKTKKVRFGELEPLVDKIHELNSTKKQIETTIRSEKEHLEKKISDLQGEVNEEAQGISEKREETSKIPELLKTEKELTREIEALPALAELLTALNREVATLKQEVKGKRDRSKELNSELEELRKIGIGAPCPKCKQQLTQHHYVKVEQDYLATLEELKNSATELDVKIEDTKTKITENSTEEKTLKSQEQELTKLREALSALKQQEKTLKGLEEAIGKKRNTLEENVKKLASEEFCKHEKEQLAKTLSAIEELNPTKAEFEKIKERIRVLEREKTEEYYITHQSNVKNKITVTEDLENCREQAQTLTAEAESIGSILKSKNIEYDQEKPVLKTIKELENAKKGLEQQFSDENKAQIETIKDIQRAQEEIKRIETEIEKREEQLLKFQELKQYQIWISEFFIPAIKLIETNVLANINSEFNSLFQKWLGHLLETGDIAVRVDENFTPIIEQNGYEMDVNSLSGGEKTSVALAYRLALNVMVKKVCKAMQSNLLILDEPTDGFSREQLFRLRDILKELNCEQVIFVSHESELEGFVDKIFRITKEAGESRISVN